MRRAARELTTLEGPGVRIVTFLRLRNGQLVVATYR
jgi:hypothetical protein